jgi:hypothetical protein
MRTYLALAFTIQCAVASYAVAETHRPTQAGSGNDGVILIQDVSAQPLPAQRTLSNEKETYVRISLVGASAVVQDSWWSDRSGAATSTVSFGEEKYNVASYFEFKRKNFGTPSFNTTIVNCRKIRQETNTIRFSGTLAAFKKNTQLAVALTTIGKASVSIAAQLAKSYIPGTNIAEPLSAASDEIIQGFNASIQSGSDGKEILWPAESGLTITLANLKGAENYVVLYRGDRDYYERIKRTLIIKDYALYCRDDDPDDLPGTGPDDLPRTSSSNRPATYRAVEDGIWFLFKVEKLSQFDGERPWSPGYRNLQKAIRSVPGSISIYALPQRKAAIATAIKNLWRSAQESSPTANSDVKQPKSLGDQVEEMNAQISSDPLLTDAEITSTTKSLIDLVIKTNAELVKMEGKLPK